MTWRYLAQRHTRDGPVEFVHMDVPLRDVQLEDVLSGPMRLTATIEPASLGMKGDDGQPLFDEWSTMIWAESGGEIRGGGILVSSGFEGSRWQIDCMGLSGYPNDLPYTAEYKQIQIDPLQVYRDLWSHVQSQAGGDLGVVVDDTTSPIRIGTEEVLVDFTTGLGEVVRFESGPVKFAPWLTDDIGGEMNKLAEETPFDYREIHRWDGEEISHRIMLGYPRLGRRREDLRFVVGENLMSSPTVNRDGEGYANSVLVLGAGEGREMIQGWAHINDGRMRKIRRVADKSIRSISAANQRANLELASSSRVLRIDSIAVLDHPHARLGDFEPGDEVPVVVKNEWLDVEMFCRVVSLRISPENPEVAVASLVRSDLEVV